eukprot:scaffold13912_cov108-Isochrysis_galbana.AAC.3
MCAPPTHHAHHLHARCPSLSPQHTTTTTCIHSPDPALSSRPAFFDPPPHPLTRPPFLQPLTPTPARRSTFAPTRGAWCGAPPPATCPCRPPRTTWPRRCAGSAPRTSPRRHTGLPSAWPAPTPSTTRASKTCSPWRTSPHESVRCAVLRSTSPAAHPHSALGTMDRAASYGSYGCRTRAGATWFQSPCCSSAQRAPL